MYELGEKFICKYDLEKLNKVTPYRITGFVNNEDKCIIKFCGDRNIHHSKVISYCELEDDYLPYKGIVRTLYD